MTIALLRAKPTGRRWGSQPGSRSGFISLANVFTKTAFRRFGEARGARNRVTGGPVMPTIACHMQLLRPGEKTQARRGVCCTSHNVRMSERYPLALRQADQARTDFATIESDLQFLICRRH
jgi:hypothetical protein